MIAPLTETFLDLTRIAEILILVITVILYLEVQVTKRCECYRSIKFCHDTPDSYYLENCGSQYECSLSWGSNLSCGFTLAGYKYVSPICLFLIFESIAKIFSLFYPKSKSGNFRRFLFVIPFLIDFTLLIYPFFMYEYIRGENLSFGDTSQVGLAFVGLCTMLHFAMTALEHIVFKLIKMKES
jgi:hypothetical protein